MNTSEVNGSPCVYTIGIHPLLSVILVARKELSHSEEVRNVAYGGGRANIDYQEKTHTQP